MYMVDGALFVKMLYSKFNMAVTPTVTLQKHLLIPIHCSCITILGPHYMKKTNLEHTSTHYMIRYVIINQISENSEIGLIGFASI